MRAILVRIGIDHAYGEWNAPVDPDTGDFVFVPIPDGAAKRHAHDKQRRYDEMQAPLSRFASRHGLTESARYSCPEALLSLNMHLDPDFDHLTYGDNGAKRGAGIATLNSGDLVVFYAGLRSIKPSYKLLYCLVGLFVVDEVVRANTIPPSRLHENAHTRWEGISANDIVVRAKPQCSGRFDRGLPMGEWRDNAYRVCRQVEDAWGGLSVKNGYIQRSAVPPSFLDPEKFYRWFHRQGVTLLQRNN